MSDELKSIEQSPIKSHAESWVSKRGIKPEAPKSAKEDLTQSAQQVYDLFLERQDLRADLLRRTTPGSDQNHERTLEEKMRLIKAGRASDVLAAFGNLGATVDILARDKTRIEEVEKELDRLLSTPGVYERYQEGYHHQIRVRQQAKEVSDLEGVIGQVDLVALRLAREAQVQGRALTSAERKIVDENHALKEEAVRRSHDLLKDPDVFDRVRVLELTQYRRQLESDRFAETPSRARYLKKIEQYWSEGKRVLLTGETGTGKTETIKHASRKLFGTNPESVTGHQDMSIYELLGKTGFRVQEGDVFRPAPMVRAMTGRDGNGLPFLFDEIDRAPNQSVMGIKTILNARPGEKGLKVQTDSAGSFDVGKDYAVSATANIKSEKYITATELDPAIVRVFDAPMDIDYMPAFEVYDLALAQLLDKRGGIPLSETDAKVILRNLCDAASWIQDAYQGRKVITDSSSESYLTARGEASKGKPATLRKALLDPGRTLDMLRGWQSASVRGVTFEEYLNEKIIEFINNRAYPDEDRYYLTQIFALKGFLKGHKPSELLVSNLAPDVLEALQRVKKSQSKETAPYLTSDKVARLDPYKRFKRPISLEAEELLEGEETEVEEEEQAGTAEPKEFGRGFTRAERESLEKAGYVIYNLTGESITSLIAKGKKFYSDWHKQYPLFEGLPSRRGEIAINPRALFLPDSKNKDLKEQEDMVNKFSDELKKRLGLKNVKAVIGEAADYVDLAFKHLDKTGEYLFGDKYGYNYTRTKTQVDSSGPYLAVVGYFRSRSGLYVVHDCRPDVRSDYVLVSPLVVPV